MKSSGVSFRDHLKVSPRDIGFKRCLADPDVWMRLGTRPDSFDYWEYCLCHVDNVLVASHEPQKMMEKLLADYTLKEEISKEPDFYLGARTSKCQLPGSNDPYNTRLAMSSDYYVKSAITNLEIELNKTDSKLLVKVEALVG